MPTGLTVLLGPMRNPNRCPRCGEHVSPFAAGCAICGAKLDPERGLHVTLAERLRRAWRLKPTEESRR